MVGDHTMIKQLLESATSRCIDVDIHSQCESLARGSSATVYSTPLLQCAVRSDHIGSKPQHPAAMGLDQPSIERQLMHSQLLMAPEVTNVKTADACVAHVEKVEHNLRRRVQSVEQQHRPCPFPSSYSACCSCSFTAVTTGGSSSQRLRKLFAVRIAPSSIWQARYLRCGRCSMDH